MKVEVHHNYYLDPGTEAKLDQINRKLDKLLKMEVITMGRIDELTTELLDQVSEMDDINDSLDAVFAKLAQLVQEGRTDPAKLEQAISIITTQKERTKAAIVANTPAEEPPPPPPTQ